MLTDAILVDRVLAGFDGAFDELYRRHATTAWRVAQAVTGDSHDAADAVSEAFARVLQAVRAGRLDDGDAFRAYLLTATRNAALDGLRRKGRVRPAADGDLDRPAAEAEPADAVASSQDAQLAAAAFRNLPERWRSVLWLTEVEGVPTKEAAQQLGLSANGTAQLAVRARAGLRERFLQAHLRDEPDPACRFAVDRLGAYVGGGLSPRDLAKVDQHLADCERCRARKDELDDVGSTLRRIVLPLPLGLAALSEGRVRTALAAVAEPTGAPGMAARAVARAMDPTPAMRKLVAASAAGVLGLGLLSLGVVGGNAPDIAELTAPPRQNTSATTVPSLPPAQLTTSSALLPTSVPSDTGLAHRASKPAVPTQPIGPAPADVPAAAPAVSEPAPTASEPAPTPSPTPAPSSPAAPTAPASPALPDPVGEVLEPIIGGGEGADEPVVDLNTGVRVGDHSAGVSISLGTEPKVSISLDGQPLLGGEPDPVPADDGIQLDLGGQLLPPISLSLP